MRMILRSKTYVASLLLAASALVAACKGSDGPSPLSGFDGYAFPGAQKIAENDDGTWIVSWTAAPVPGSTYFVYSRTAPAAYDFSKAAGPGTTEAFFKTPDLRYAAQTCFVVRLSVTGLNPDTNTNEVCSVPKPRDFSGAKTAEIGADGRVTVSWTQVPQGRGNYLVRRILNDVVDATVLAKTADASTTLGPFSLGQELCFQVQYAEAGFPDTANTAKACVAKNLLGDFSGVERIASTDTEKVSLDWNPSTNSLVAGYNVYLGDDYKTRLMSLPGREQARVTLSGQTKGRRLTYAVRAFTSYGVEDTNTKTLTVLVTDLTVPRFDGIKGATVLPNTLNVELKWNPSPDAQSLSKYRIYKGTSNVNGVPVIDWSTVVAEVPWDSTSYIVQNVGDELRYGFGVHVVNDFGVESINTDSLTVVTPDAGAPVFAGIESASLDGERVVLTWKAAVGETRRYFIYYAKGSAGAIDFSTPKTTEPGTSTMSILSGFQSGQVYTFSVRAEDSHGNVTANVTKAFSLNVGTQSPPKFLGYVSASGVDENTVRLEYYRTPDTNISFYKIIARLPGSTTPFLTLFQGQPASGQTVVYQIGNLQAATTYEFLVVPVDTFFNEGDNTTVIRGATLKLSPPAFAGATGIGPLLGTANLTWQPRSTVEITGFAVYWSSASMVGTPPKVMSQKLPLPTDVFSSGPLPANASNYKVAGLLKNQTYYFIVHAFDQFGNEDSNTSEKSMAIPNSPPVLVADVAGRSTNPLIPAATITLTATDVDLYDTLTFDEITNTCPPDSKPVRTDASQIANSGRRTASVVWQPSAAFVPLGATTNSCLVLYRVADGTTYASAVPITFTATNRAPINPTVSFVTLPNQTAFNRYSPLKCTAQATDPDNDPLTITYEWRRNGSLIAGVNGDTLSPVLGTFTPGAVIQCSALITDGHSTVIAVPASPATFGNSPPTNPTVAISDDDSFGYALSGHKVRCDFAATDADNDVLLFGTISIERNDGTVSAPAWNDANLLEGPCATPGSQRKCFVVTGSSNLRGKDLRCRVGSVTDGYSTALASFSSTNTVNVHNSTPTISNVFVTPTTGLAVGSTLTCHRTLDDADGDSLVAPTIAWTRDNTPIAGAVGDTYQIVLADRNRDIKCRVSLAANADGYGSLAVDPVLSNAVRYTNSNPVLSNVAVVRQDAGSLSSVYLGTILQCGGTIFDPDGDIDGTTVSPSKVVYQWYKDDVPISNAAGQLYVVQPSERTHGLKCAMSLLQNADGNGSDAQGPLFSANVVTPKNRDPIFTLPPTISYQGNLTTGASLTCNSSGIYNDPDGDTLANPTFLWKRDGAIVFSSAITPLYQVVSADRNHAITCQLLLAANADQWLSAAVSSSNSTLVTPLNSNPSFTSVSVDARVGDLYPGDELRCLAPTVDPDGDAVTVVYEWLRDNGSSQTTIVGETKYNYIAQSIDRNTNILCRATLPVNADGHGSTPAVTVASLAGKLINNRVPVVSGAAISPTAAFRGDQLSCLISGTDPDADALSATYRWRVNGSIVKNNDAVGTLKAAAAGGDAGVVLTPNTVVTCESFLSDGIATVAGPVKTITILNNPPYAITTATLSAHGGGTIYNSSATTQLDCSAQFGDDDGDPLTLSYKWYVGGALQKQTAVGSLNAASDGVSWARGQTLSCMITATDGYDITSSSSGNSTVANSPPTGILVCKRNNVTISAPVEIFSGDPVSGIVCSGISDLDGDSPTYYFESTTCGTSIVMDPSGTILSSSVMPSTDCQAVVRAYDSVDSSVIAASTMTLNFAQPFSLASTYSVDGSCIAKANLIFIAGTQHCDGINVQSGQFGAATSSVWFDPGAGNYGTYTQLGVGSPTAPSCQTTLTRKVSGTPGTGTLSWTLPTASFSRTLSKNLSLTNYPAAPTIPSLAAPLAVEGMQPFPAMSGGSAVGCSASACTGTQAQMALGGSHSCVIGSDSKPYCWGSNAAGQIGLALTTTKSTTPVPITLGANAVGISGGGSGTATTGFACALRSDGKVMCWGANNYAQLGRGATGTATPTPDYVSGLTGVTIVAIASGVEHSCALDNAGKIWCWGRNPEGRIGDNSQTDAWVPVNPVTLGTTLDSGAKGLALGAKHTCAISNTNEVFCWGDNTYGQLGTGSYSSIGHPVIVSGLSNVVQVVAGDYFTCALSNNAGVSAVLCWGQNGMGQLGIGSANISKNTPQTTLFDASEPVASLSARQSSACALLQSGMLKCWGDNSSGQLGIGTTTGYQTRPVFSLDVIYDARAVARGAAHTCIVKAASEVYCMGANTYNQLGVTSTQSRPTLRSMPNSSAGAPAPQFKRCDVFSVIPQN